VPSRFAYERAVRDSGLPPPARHIALTLATWANVTTGVIPDEYMPSLTKLADSTGLDRSTVRRHLDRLEAEGWVERIRPSATEARRKKKRTRYRLLSPLEADQGADELGAQNPKVGGTEPLTEGELGAQRPQVGGAQPPELGAQNTRVGGTAPPSSSKYQEVPYQSQRAGARETTTGKPSITEQLDAAARAACAELGRRTGREITPRWGRRVAMHILDSARGVVDEPDRYVAAVRA
jgi:DNA-binding transcriptional ArsR family regulator